MEQCIVYNPYRNHTVTDRYVSFVEECLTKCNIKTKRIQEITKAEKNTGAFVVYVNDVPKARRMGYSPILLWVQGITPEESFMRNRSRVRAAVLSCIEYRGLRQADAYLFVSESMHSHFNTKYHKKFDNCYIMPCFNDEIVQNSFFSPGKYSNNQFLYAGGLQVWQCFEETITMYKEIEDIVGNCSLRVLTKDQEKAGNILSKFKIRNYSIGYVSPDNIGEELKKAKFGFSLREDNPVNRVATPTKLSTYIAHGVIPIYSTVLQGFGSVAKTCPYCIGIDNNHTDGIEAIVDLCNSEIKPEEVLQSFRDTFSAYYSSEYHQEHLTDFLKKLI